VIVAARKATVENIVARLKEYVSEFNLVKPYDGELDRYSKKTQLQESIFPAQVSLLTPFALVISKSRKPTLENRKLTMEHDFSVYVGVSNTHDFSNVQASEAFSLLEKSWKALEDFAPCAGSLGLHVIEEGEYLITTDLFIVYD
jgi:hypothetical protein